jgi:hypothetical protein
MYSNAQNRMRMRVYNCFNDIKVSIVISINLFDALLSVSGTAALACLLRVLIL